MRVLMAFLLVLAVSSCAKHENYTLRDANESIMGKYQCTSIVWNGTSVDLNNDGTASEDIATEFGCMNFCQIVIETPLYIKEATEIDQYVYFYLEVPMQDIRYNKIDDTYELQNSIYGNGMNIGFSFIIDSKGSISFRTNPENDSVLTKEYPNSIDHYEYQFTNAKGISFINPGVIVVNVNSAYYDHLTGEMVYGVTEYRYERSSYSYR